MLAAIWVVVKHLDEGFRRQIPSPLLLRFNFVLVGFKSLPIVESVRFHDARVANHHAATKSGFLMKEKRCDILDN